MVLLGRSAFQRSANVLFAGAALIFLATIALGIANAFMAQVTHAQVLAHFHSGTIGWVTLSVLGATLWMFGSGTPPTPGLKRTVDRLVPLVPVVVAGYVGAFGYSFSGGPAWLLPLFGIPAAIAIWGGLALALARWKAVPTHTTPHLLLLGALTVASLGALMGVLIGLGHAFQTAPVETGAHAGPMDMYLALAFAALIEAFLRPDAGKWRWPGMTQAILGTVAGFAVSARFLLGIEPLAPVALLLLVLTFLFYFVRIGWRAIAQVARPGLFWAGLAFPAYIGLFVFMVAAYFIQGADPPHALMVTFQHVTFIGLASNVIVTTHLARSTTRDRTAEAGIWLTNVGLVAFIVGEFVAESPHGALVMAAGLLVVLARILPGTVRGAIGAQTRPKPAA